MVEKLARDHFHKLAQKTFADPKVFARMHDNPDLYNDLVNVARENSFYGVPHHTNDVLDLYKKVNNKWSTQKGPPSHPLLPDDRLHDAIFSATRGNIPQSAGNNPGSQYEKLRTSLHGESDPSKGRVFKNVADVIDNGVISTLDAMKHPHADDWKRGRDKYRSALLMNSLSDKLHPDILHGAHEELSLDRPYLRGESPAANSYKPMQQDDGQQQQSQLNMPMNEKDMILSMLGRR